MNTFDECTSVELSVAFDQSDVKATRSEAIDDCDVVKDEAAAESARVSVSDVDERESTEDGFHSSDDGFADVCSETPSTDAPESEIPSMDRTSTMDPIKVEPSFLVVKGPPPGFESQPQQPRGSLLKASAQQAPEFDKLEQLKELQQLMDEVAVLEKQLANFTELAAKQMQSGSTGRTSLRSVHTNAKMFVPMQGNGWGEPMQSNYWVEPTQSNEWPDWTSPQSNDWADWAAPPVSAPPGLESGY